MRLLATLPILLLQLPPNAHPHLHEHSSETIGFGKALAYKAEPSINFLYIKGCFSAHYCAFLTYCHRLFLRPTRYIWAVVVPTRVKHCVLFWACLVCIFHAANFPSETKRCQFTICRQRQSARPFWKDSSALHGGALWAIETVLFAKCTQLNLRQPRPNLNLRHSNHRHIAYSGP